MSFTMFGVAGALGLILWLLVTILIGALIGWLAGMIMKSKHGFWMNCLVGIVGSFIGGFIAGLVHIGGGWIVGLLFNILGTCLLILILRLIFGKKW